MNNKLVYRRMYPEIAGHLDAPEITVIIGPRQVGKTTLVFQLKEELLKRKNVQPEHVYYFNLDIVSDRTIFATQTEFINFLKNRISPDTTLYVFIDEVQRIENSGLFFKGVYDLGLPVKLVLTGSSSLEIRAKIVEPLTGRKKLFQLFPLDFAEYVSFHDAGLLRFLSQDDAYAKEKLLEYLYTFISFGGYPKVALDRDREKKIGYLEEIFTSYVEKDVVGFLRIKDAFVFSRLVKILAEEIGNLFNVQAISRELGIKNKTVSRYVDILEQTYIAQRAVPFFGSTRSEVRKMPKIYFLDTGMRNFAIYGRDFPVAGFSERKDKGFLLENFIFSELVKTGSSDVHFWRTKDDAEVDFIVQRSGETIPIEVKTASEREVGPSRSFLSFIRRYKPRTGVMVSLHAQPPRTIDSTRVFFQLPYQLAPFFANTSAGWPGKIAGRGRLRLSAG